MDLERPRYELTLDELRLRVQEAEKLLRVARQLAADELRDPEQSSRAKDRIASLCKEVNALFPTPAEPEPVPDTEAEAQAEAPDAGVEEAEAEGDDLQDTAEDEDTAEDGEEDEDEDEDDEDWAVDFVKLRAAIQNPVLMDQIPEADRTKFREMAEALLEAHERQELYARVTAGFEELERTTREGAEEVGRQLAMALTFEELGRKYKA